MEQFIEQLKSLSRRVEKISSSISTEEATKTSIIMPFFQILGYDIFNPEEFVPEFVADVGIKKGEKVDYAILHNGEPAILIEAKSVNQPLEKYDSQLFRYFGTTKAKFAILTNGIEYWFYTDLEEQNKMDASPFFKFNLLEIRDNHFPELAKFRKNNFDVENILTTASELKYTNEIKQYLSEQLDNPSEEFVSFILGNVYTGKKTRSVIEKFSVIVKKSLKQFVNELVNDKLKAALNNTNEEAAITSNEQKNELNEQLDDNTKNKTPEIVTTEEEIEGYVLVKILLRSIVEPERVYYRDNLSYCNVLLDNNIRKWIVRLYLNTSNKYIQLNDKDKTTYSIASVSDIENYKNEIIKVAQNFLD